MVCSTNGECAGSVNLCPLVNYRNAGTVWVQFEVNEHFLLISSVFSVSF